MQKKNYFPARHFIMIPFEDPQFIEGYKKLCQKLEDDSPNYFDYDLLQKPSKLHISALIFDLNEDEEKIKKVCSVMKDIQEEIKKISEGNITYKFGGYGAFDSFEKARVVYAKMEEDENYEKMKKIIDLLIKKLLEEGLINKSQLGELPVNQERSSSNPTYAIVMHLTLMNTTFLNKVLKKSNHKPIKNFDATDIYDTITSITLPDCPLKKIDFCVLRENKSTGKYEVVQSFDLI